MDEIIKLITDGATRLGFAFEYAYPKVIMAYWIEGVYYAIALPFYFVGSVLLLRFWAVPALMKADREYTALNQDQRDETPYIPIMFLIITGALTLVCLVSMIIILFHYPYYLKVTFAPEGQFILDMVKNAAKK